MRLHRISQVLELAELMPSLDLELRLGWQQELGLGLGQELGRAYCAHSQTRFQLPPRPLSPLAEMAAEMDPVSVVASSPVYS